MKSPPVGSTRIFGRVGALVLVLVLICVNDSLARTGPASRNSVGDGCRLQSGRRGQCRLITDCPSAVAEVRNAARRGNTISLQRCGFKGTTEIVCCERSSGGGGNGQGSRTQGGGVRPLPGNGNLGHRKPWLPGTGGTPMRDSEWLPDGNRNSNGGGRNMGRPSQPQQERKAVAACRVYTSECPAKVSPYIVGGTVAALGEFPHMAALGYSATEMGQTTTRWDCGGTLISKRYVLTAAHCSSITNRKPHVVRLGESDFARDDDGATPIDIPIESLTTHPDYVSATRYNDIALVRLQREVQLNEFVCPACLYTGAAPERSSRLSSRMLDTDEDASRSNFGDDYEPDLSLTSRILPDGEEVGPRQNDIEDLRNRALLVTGWGDTDFGGDRSSVLLKASLQAITVNDCNSALQRSVGRSISLIPRGVIQNVQLCAGDLSGKNDTCQGDSGGPLQFQNKDSATMHTVVGVTSFGSKCGISVPAVYTRVSSFIDWIENIVWPQGPPS